MSRQKNPHRTLLSGRNFHGVLRIFTCERTPALDINSPRTVLRKWACPDDSVYPHQNAIRSHTAFAA
eukprot:m.626945 g.626945  ORF g.626945 m.626945 type:complete len:67 (+) comp22553_c0_seq46:806-1006(+)